jgi:hypothetical protein
MDKIYCRPISSVERANALYLQTESWSTLGKCKFGKDCPKQMCFRSHPVWKPCKFKKMCINVYCRFAHPVDYVSQSASVLCVVESNIHKSIIMCEQTGKEYNGFIQRILTDNGIEYYAYNTMHIVLV